MTIENNGKKSILKKDDLKTYNFEDNQKIFYDNKLLDFIISNDSLIFFDRVEEIEVVNLKINKKVSSEIKVEKKKNFTCTLFANNFEGTFIQISNDVKQAYVKSIKVFPKKQFHKKGKIRISILNINNGFPEDFSPIISFDKELSELNDNKWDIVLPKIIKNPKEGFFLVFYYENKKLDFSSTRLLDVKCADNSVGYIKCCGNNWKKINFPGLQYRLKILQ